MLIPMPVAIAQLMSTTLACSVYCVVVRPVSVFMNQTKCNRLAKR